MKKILRLNIKLLILIVLMRLGLFSGVPAPITRCDDSAINADPAYATPTSTPPSECELDCGDHAIPDYQNCICFYVGDTSPILIDISGDGFDLTDGAGGINFDINADGAAERISWTTYNCDDAWLTLA